MPYLRVRTEAGDRRIPFTPGGTLRELLAGAGFPIRSGCAGVGACGLCLVRIEAGEVPPPTENELRMLRPEQMRRGERLACQVVPARGLTLAIDPAPLCPAWLSLPADAPGPPLPAPAERRAVAGGTSLGVAVDLGTTHIRLTLWDLAQGKRLSGRTGANPQALFGSDVMTRLTAACASREDAAQLARLARDAIGAALSDIAAREGCRLAEIGRVAIVGNSAMLALLAQRNYDLLLKPAYWTRAIDCRPEGTASWCSAWGIDPRAAVELLQPLAGFVGSDLLAGVLATRLTGEPGGALLIDFGTNSEIALWDGATLWVTSAAGGPAFEGCGISCGMPAEPGAIYRIEAQRPAPGFRCEVIGGGRAQGICGSGLVDIIALLRSAGVLNGAGSFSAEVDSRGVAIQEQGGLLLLNGRDIDGFQRAKAAIGAGTRCLMQLSGLHLGQLKRVCVCGAFGRFLHVPNAQSIGLLPEVPAEGVELCGNSALAGCELLLFSRDISGTLAALAGRARTINLAQAPGFEELFVESLYLRPLRMDP